MQFRIRTLLIYTAISAMPIWVGAEAARQGCLRGVVGVWASFALIPLLSGSFFYSMSREEKTGEEHHLATLMLAIAVVCFPAALFVSWVFIDLSNL
ncbi:MAG: hypothetical protein JWN86_3053 [Planctomycetota bacterium]|nr:hypothetical protein [Planctomycetota bacterium]